MHLSKTSTQTLELHQTGANLNMWQRNSFKEVNLLEIKIKMVLLAQIIWKIIYSEDKRCFFAGKFFCSSFSFFFFTTCEEWCENTQWAVWLLIIIGFMAAFSEVWAAAL